MSTTIILQNQTGETKSNLGKIGTKMGASKEKPLRSEFQPQK
jgi:hypothetical protein